MSAETFAYPFLCIAIFFESFLLVTLLSAPTRAARTRKFEGEAPSVSIVVPCYSEESSIAATVHSLLGLTYPKDKLTIVLVDDGSTDNTRSAMETFRTHEQVRIIHKENGGKHTALNAGIALLPAEIIGCLDADSFVEPDALKEVVACFADPKVAAATAAMSVHKPGNILQHMQYAEYIFGISVRHALASVNGLYVTPGPFSLYRSSVLKEVGVFRYGYQTEDMEMALRLQKAGYVIENAPRARVYTKTPHTITRLLQQRTRWTTGFLRNMIFSYRDLILNPRHGTLGMLVLPLALLSIVNSIFLFGVFLFYLGTTISHAYAIRSGIPASYALMPNLPTLDWFYFPTSLFFILSILTLIATLLLTHMGKRISRTPGNLSIGIVSFFLFYGLLDPLWLIRASTDVLTGKKRAWR